MKLIPAYLVLTIQVVLVSSTCGQTNTLLTDVPAKYLNEFKDDQRKYIAATFPSVDSAHRVYNLWADTRNGYLKKYSEDSLLKAYRFLHTNEISSKIEYIKQNPNSYASLYYLRQDLLIPTVSLYVHADSLLSIYSLLNNDLKTTPLGNAISKDLLKRNALAIGKKLPVFTFKTDKGIEHSLSSFQKQKYVLLTFWASWCQPCRENIPALKEVEKRYRDNNLQIISISVDEDAGKWLKAVEKYQMPWAQTCDLPAYIEGNISQSLYDIKYVPQYFLIDKEGVLIYHNVLSKDDDSHSKLNSILQKVLD